MRVRANGIDIEVEDSGGPGPAILLIMGLGMPLVAWPDAMVQGLVGAGYRVIRHDNRDAGLSQGFAHAPWHALPLELARGRLGLRMRAAYTVQDMAEDAVQLLEALSIDRAHVLGASMGGMIAQRMAASAPARVASLTSIMSSSGARGLPWPRHDIALALLKRPRDDSEEAAIDALLSFLARISGPGYPMEEAQVRERVRQGFRRGRHPTGAQRQLLAVLADTGHRPAVLPSIRCPTLVLHGQQDRFIPPACGRDTAARIAGARFQSIPGMGHDLPAAVVPLILSLVLPHLAHAAPGPASAGAVRAAVDQEG